MSISIERAENNKFDSIDREEARCILGTTSSTNRIEFTTYENKVVIKKVFARKDGEKYASNEACILRHLAEKTYRTNVVFPRLAKDDIIWDEEGNPCLYIAPEPKYTPFSADKSIKLELDGKTAPIKLQNCFKAICVMHTKYSVLHNDLHLDNIGFLPPYTGSSLIRNMIIDFDQSEKCNYLTPREITKDLFIFTKNLLAICEEEKSAKQRIREIVLITYHDLIDVDTLFNQL